MTMLPVTYGYARVSKSDDATRNLDTQLRSLGYLGIRADLIFLHVASVRTLRGSGWQELRGPEPSQAILWWWPSSRG